MAHLHARPFGALIGSLVGVSAILSTSCGADRDVLVSQIVGPEGAELTADGIVVDIPAGALATEVEITVKKSTADLSVADFSQIGDAIVIEPTDLELLLPVRVKFDGEEGSANLLFRESAETVVWGGDTAYSGSFGTLARADEGTAIFEFDMPSLGTSPNSPGAAHTDSVHLEASSNSRRLDIRVTAWDFDDEYGPLNGDGHCGFKVSNIEGGSVTTGCTSGEVTASIAVTEDWIKFDLEPFLAPALPSNVPVTVIASDGELGFAVGFFAFGTSDCYHQECGGHGTCDNGSGAAVCTCEDGYATMEDPMLCECVPQCSGLACGSDSCGGQCGTCGNDTCENGVCVPVGDGDGDSGDGDGDGTTTGDGDGDGMTGDGDGTSGDGDGDGTSGDGDGTT